MWRVRAIVVGLCTVVMVPHLLFAQTASSPSLTPDQKRIEALEKCKEVQAGIQALVRQKGSQTEKVYRCSGAVPPGSEHPCTLFIDDQGTLSENCSAQHGGMPTQRDCVIEVGQEVAAHCTVLSEKSTSAYSSAGSRIGKLPSDSPTFGDAAIDKLLREGALHDDGSIGMPASRFLDEKLLGQVADRGLNYQNNLGAYTPDMKAGDALTQMARDENFYGFLPPNTPVNYDAQDSVARLNERNALEDSFIGQSFPQISASLPKPDPMPSPFYASFRLQERSQL
jgi:hypothetical protein